MMFDPGILLRAPLSILAVLGVIMIGKPLAAVAIVLAFRHPLGTALTIAASLAQIGEFSFIPVSPGLSLKLLPEEGRNLILGERCCRSRSTRASTPWRRGSSRSSPAGRTSRPGSSARTWPMSPSRAGRRHDGTTS
ncbi:hypothetical protein ACU4GR_30150 [Methylobacterium oryzae CBMB20]